MIRKCVLLFLGIIIPLTIGQRQANAASSLDTIKQTGILKVCLAQGLPDQYKDPQTGKWTGVMVDLINRLASWMKVKVQIVETSWDVIVLSLKQGRCDMIGASLIYNAPRAMEISYVRPFGAKGINLVVRKDNSKIAKMHDPADLNRPDITIVAEIGGREQEASQRLFPKAKIMAVKVNSPLEVADFVKRGDADAAALPAITVKWWLQVPENAAWGAEGFPGKDFGNAANGWAVRYGDPDFKSFLDAYVRYVRDNHISDDLYNQYLNRTNPFRPVQ